MAKLDFFLAGDEESLGDQRNDGDGEAGPLILPKLGAKNETHEEKT